LYSPKISEDIVPQLYQLAKQEKKPMTKYVNEILLAHLAEKVEDKPVSTESTLPQIKSKVA
jgi:hypothetical protein